MEHFYNQLDIRAKMHDLVLNMGCVLVGELSGPKTPELQPASIQYYTTGELEEPQDESMAV